MSRPTWFEIEATHPSSAMRFRAGLVGWPIPTVDPATLGVDVGLMPRRGPPPVDGRPVDAHACAVDVDDADDAVAKVPGPGVEIVVPTFAVPSVGGLAYARGPQRNRFGVRRMDDRAS